MCVFKLFWVGIECVCNVWVSWEKFSPKVIQLWAFKQMVCHCSSRHGQRGQPESVIAPILFRCAFRGTCWHLRRKMVTCSSLLRRLILSLGLGVVICVNMDLPVALFAHSFLQSSVLYCLIVCLAVFIVAVLFNRGHLASCF